MNKNCDVCILGAGVAGLTLARGLANSGKSVVLIERGGQSSLLNTDSTDVEFIRNTYSGATEGRGIGLGGTSAYWGGQLLSIHDEEMRRGSVKADWPFNRSALSSHFSRIDHWLNMPHTSENQDDLTTSRHQLSTLNFSTIQPRLSKWLPFKKRNLHSAWKNAFNSANNIEILTGYNLARVHTDDEDGKCKVTRMQFSAEVQTDLIVAANDFIIACGALDSPAIADKIASAAGASINAEYNGRYLHDHLAMNIASINVHNRKRFLALFSPFYDAGIMRSIRLEPNPKKHDYKNRGAAYFHFVSKAAENSGFTKLRYCMQGIQSKDLKKIVYYAVRLPFALPELLEIAWWRAIRNRLVFPAKSSIFLQINLEQKPTPDNLVRPAEDNSSSNKICVDWCAGKIEQEDIDYYINSFQNFWDENDLSSVASLNFLPTEKLAASESDNIYDIYHPAGTCRMSTAARDGVVDENLRLHEFNNLYIASTAVFPHMGAANPTYTLMALCSKLCDHLLDRKN